MSISSFTMVTMLDTRPSPITISMPRTNDIPNRVITFKDIYGNAPFSSITLVTQGGDIFENSSFSTILSNAYDTVTFHAGLPGRWHRTAGTNIVGGMNASSTFTNSLSTSVTYAGFFIGDGSRLTNVTPTFSGTTNFNNITVSNLGIFGSISNTGNFSNVGILSNFGAVLLGNSITQPAGQTATFGATTTQSLNAQALTTASISNTGNFSNVGILSNYGAVLLGNNITQPAGQTATLGILYSASHSNTGNFSNVGILSNYGAVLLGNNITQPAGQSATLGITTTQALTTASISNTGNFSNVGILSNYGAVLLGNNITQPAGSSATLGITTTQALTSASHSNTGNFSNVGILSNTGNVIFGGTLGVTGATTLTGTLTPTGGIITAGGISNTSILSNTGNAILGGTLGVTGNTTLAVTLTSGFSNTGAMCNSGLFSTNTLNAGAMSNNNLTFYDQYTASTGTFRYSTLTTLVALPNTSLLFFNNFVVAGAYVWPGQTISALDWTGLYVDAGGIYPGAGNIGIPPGNNSFNITIFSNVTGGTPPYTVSMSPNYLATNIIVGFGSTGLSLYTSSSTTSATNVGPSNVTFTILDSSTPRFQSRPVTFSWKTGAALG